MKKNSASIKRINEKKAIDLVAEILQSKIVIRNKGGFDWLRGDFGTKLCVDGYLPNEKLVIEYQGKQHYSPNKLMDRRPGRREQRQRYVELRQRLIPKHGLKLLEIKYDEPLTIEHLKPILKKMGFKV